MFPHEISALLSHLISTCSTVWHWHESHYLAYEASSLFCNSAASPWHFVGHVADTVNNYIFFLFIFVCLEWTLSFDLLLVKVLQSYYATEASYGWLSVAPIILWSVYAHFWQDNSAPSFIGSNAGGSYFRAGESGPKQEWFCAEVDRGQWLIPPENSRSDGGGKARQTCYMKEGRERNTHNPNLWVHLFGVSSLSNCPCFTACIKEAFNELEWPALMLHLSPDWSSCTPITSLFVNGTRKCDNCIIPKQIFFSGFSWVKCDFLASHFQL